MYPLGYFVRFGENTRSLLKLLSQLYLGSTGYKTLILALLLLDSERKGHCHRELEY